MKFGIGVSDDKDDESYEEISANVSIVFGLLSLVCLTTSIVSKMSDTRIKKMRLVCNGSKEHLIKMFG